MFKSKTLKLDPKQSEVYCKLLIIAAVALAYMFFVPAHLSIDSWTTNGLHSHLDAMQEGHLQAVWKEAMHSGFSAGRFSRGIVFLLFAVPRKATCLTLPWVNVFAIVFTCLSGVKLWKLVCPNEDKNKPLTLMCCILAVCNPFFTDWLQYEECNFYHYLGLYLAICAAEVLMANEVSFKNWVKASVLLTISGGFYQVTLQFFVLSAIMLAIMKAKPESLGKSFFEKAFVAMSVYAVASAVQLGFIFLLKNSRAFTYTLRSSIYWLWRAQVGLWKMEPYTGNPWSKLYTVIVIALAVRLCIFAILAEDKKKQFFYLVSAALGVAGLYASILLPLFLSEPRSPMRAIVGFWGIPLLLTVYGNCIKCDHWKARGVNAIIGVAAALLVFVNIYNCAEIGVGLYKTNAMDTMRAELMANAIEEYEQESGNVVENVAFHADDAPMYSYPGIHSSYESNRSALNVSWSDIYVLNTVSGRNFQQVDYPDDLYEEQYAGKNWDIWSDEQITFLGDTAYIILY